MRLLFSILIGFSTLFSCSYAQSGGNSISLSTSGQRSICQGDSLKINVTNLASNETYTFQWLKDDNIINGENQSSIVL
ncbi:MAG: hypothetical protein RJB31_1908, partial [Bacteroidota bacterium]